MQENEHGVLEVDVPDQGAGQTRYEDGEEARIERVKRMKFDDKSAAQEQLEMWRLKMNVVCGNTPWFNHVGEALM